ncbi:MAG: hypothetical protein NVSMB47_05150 [Polyangiales bacterium]
MSAPDRLAPAPYARPIGPLAATGWSAAILVVCYVAVSTLESLRPGAQFDDVNWALLYGASVLVVTYAIGRVHAPTTTTRDLLGARPMGLLPSLAATFMGAAAVVPLGALDAAIARKWPLAEAHAAELTHAMAAMPRSGRLVGAIAAAVLMPIADELFFRGVLATGVARHRGRTIAAVTTTVAFALVSCVSDLHYLPELLIVGALLALARFSTGSVLGAIGAHVAWRLGDLARDAQVAGTIDPLVTATYPFPSLPPAVLALSTGVALACAAVLVRYGRLGGTDERDDPQPKLLAPPTAGGTPGDDGGDQE